MRVLLIYIFRYVLASRHNVGIMEISILPYG